MTWRPSSSGGLARHGVHFSNWSGNYGNNVEWGDVLKLVSSTPWSPLPSYTDWAPGWGRREADTTQLETTQYRLTRLMLGSRPTDQVHMTSAYEVLHMLPLQVRLAEHTLTWAARVINLPVDRLPRLVMHSQLAEEKWNRAPPPLPDGATQWNMCWSGLACHPIMSGLRICTLRGGSTWSVPIETTSSPYLRKKGTMALQSSHVT